MEGLAGLFQTEVEFQAVGLVWAYLQPHDNERMHLLLTSWSLRAGFLNLLLWFAIHGPSLSRAGALCIDFIQHLHAMATIGQSLLDEMLNIKLWLSLPEQQLELVLMLEEWRNESTLVKDSFHAKFHEKVLVHPELQGINHNIARDCLLMVAPTYVVPGGPLSSGDGAHRAIESFAVYSRFPSILDGSNLQIQTSMNRTRRWIGKALHEYCKKATQLYAVDATLYDAAQSRNLNPSD